MRFFIQDLMVGEFGKNPLAKIEGDAGEYTHSVMEGPGVVPPSSLEAPQKPRRPSLTAKVRGLDRRRRNLLYGACLILLLVFYFWASSKDRTSVVNPTETAEVSKLPPNIPKEYLALTPEGQRTVEGYYNQSIHLAEKES